MSIGRSRSGVAGTADPTVTTVQGIAGAVPIPVSLSGSTNTSTQFVAKASTSAITAVNSSVTTVVLLAASANRIGATFDNQTDTPLFLALAATATTAAYTVKIPAAGYYELPNAYTGIVSGIWTGTVGQVSITELTP